ncbi:MAG: tetratricopeptide repeat-containing sensor histidine kinase [Bacteroidota bacterium]
MNLKRAVSVSFYVLILNFGFLQAQENQFLDSIYICDIGTKEGIQYLIKFSQNNSNLNPDSIDEFFKTTTGVLDRNNEYLQTIKIHFIKAILFSLQRKYVKAIDYFNELIEVEGNETNYQLQYEIFFQLGKGYQNIENFLEANSYYLKSLDIQTNIIKDSLKICNLYSYLGHTQLAMQNHDKSLYYYEKSLKLAKKIKYNYAIIKGYISIGNLMIVNQKYDEAEKLTKKSLKLAIEYKFNDRIITCYFNLAEIYFHTLIDEKAILYFKKTIESLLENEHSYLIPLCYKNLAIIYARQNNIVRQEEAIINHYKYINNYNWGYSLAQSINEINDILANNTNCNFANKYFVMNSVLLDSVLKLENEKQISIINSKHILEKEKLLNLEKINKYRVITTAGIIISTLLVFIVIILLVIRKKILSQSNIILEQNEEIIARNEKINTQNEELSSYKNHLEDLVVTRTEELKISLKKVEESNRLKSFFLENISHEIRTPMNAITGFSQLLEFKKNDPNEKYIKIISKNADKLLIFLDGVVELSKSQSVNNELIIKKVLLLPVLDKVMVKINNIKSNLGKGNIEFELINNQINENDFIFTDEAKLYSVLIHILENAFKFTDKGKVKLICEYKTEQIRFQIEDTGIGIKKTLLPYIFDLFRKIEDGDKVFRGIGIGLALAKENVELLNGEISVSSELGKGSEFMIIIPNLKMRERQNERRRKL